MAGMETPSLPRDVKVKLAELELELSEGESLVARRAFLFLSFPPQLAAAGGRAQSAPHNTASGMDLGAGAISDRVHRPWVSGVISLSLHLPLQQQEEEENIMSSSGPMLVAEHPD